MKTNHKTPEQGAVDLLGREYSKICGFSSDPLVPLGSVVTLLPSLYLSGSFQKYDIGRTAVVTGHKREYFNSRDRIGKPQVIAQFLDQLNEWEPWQNRTIWDAHHVLPTTVGTGQPPLAGKDYPLCRKEKLDALWVAKDHRCQNYANPPTYVAHNFLNTDAKHHNAVLAMARKNGTINPVRLKNYFYKQREFVMPEWARYGEGFPEHTEYGYSPDWPEIAEEFNKVLSEMTATA